MAPVNPRIFLLHRHLLSLVRKEVIVAHRAGLFADLGLFVSIRFWRLLLVWIGVLYTGFFSFDLLDRFDLVKIVINTAILLANFCRINYLLEIEDL